MIKDIFSNQKKEFEPLTDDQKIKFKFKKKGYKKLLLFDLDETLIHVKRKQYGVDDSECTDDSFLPEVEIPILDPIS